MTPAAATKSAPQTHLERGRCIACDKPYSVKVRSGIFVKCPTCRTVNPGGVMRDALNKAAVRERSAPTPSAAKPRVTKGAGGPPPAPSPPRPRKPTISATQASPSLKPEPATQPTSQPPARAKGRPSLFSRIMGTEDDE